MRKIRRALLSLAAAVVLALSLAFAQIEARNFFVVVGTGFAIVTAFLVGGVLGIVALLRRRVVTGLVAFALISGSIGSILIVRTILSYQESLSFDRGDRIVHALEEYAEANGQYPEHLSALVPDHLDRLPSTAMGLVRNVPFRYRAYEQGDYYLFFNSSLFLQCSPQESGQWLCED